MKPREFWRLSDDEEGSSSTDCLSLERAKEYKAKVKNKFPIQHWREVVPIDWEKIKKHFSKAFNDSGVLYTIQQLVEKQLAGDG